MTTINKKSRKPGRPRTYLDGGCMIYFRMNKRRDGARVQKAAWDSGLTVSAFVRQLVEAKLAKIEKNREG
jgi:hypothetical protein